MNSLYRLSSNLKHIKERRMPTKRTTRTKKLPYVLIRTYSAGVHVGELVSRRGKEVELRSARRIWFWKGAFDLNAISQRGVGVGSKIACAVPSVTLTEAIEVITCSPQAEKVLREFSEFQP